MLDKNKHIDNLFNDKLRDFSVQPAPRVWNGIENKLVDKRKKKRLLIFISTAMAASVALLFSIGLNITNTNSNLNINENIHSLAKNQPTQEKRASTQQFNQQKTSDQNDFQKTVHSKAIAKLHSNSTLNKSEFSETEVTNERSVATIHINRLNHVTIKNDKHLSIDQLITPDKNSEVNIADEMQIAKNIALLEQEKNKEVSMDKWSLIGLLASNYSNESSNSNESGTQSFGGGVKVNYKIGKNISVQAGIMYNKIGQNISVGSGQLMASEMNIATHKQLVMSTPNIPFSTSAGRIRLKKTEFPESLFAVESNTRMSSSDLAQHFETIEIPFLIRYHILNKKFGMFVSGGINTNLLISNGVYDDNNDKVGEIENLRSTNFSSQIGVGFEYQINSKLHIGLEPSFKYYINSLSKDNEYDYRPYSIGFATGIKYNF